MIYVELANKHIAFSFLVSLEKNIKVDLCTVSGRRRLSLSKSHVKSKIIG